VSGMPECLTCKWWDRVDFTPPTNHYYRACDHLSAQRPFALLLSRGVTKDAGIHTRDDFGCVEHEARE
jgi:hypothetical protein